MRKKLGEKFGVVFSLTVVVTDTELFMQDLLEDEGQHFYTYCADSKVRRCYPTLAAWMANYPEHCNLRNIKSGVCY